MHEHLPFSYALIRSLLMTLNLHVQIVDILFFDQVSMRLDMLKELEFHSTYLGIIIFPSIPFDSIVFLILYTLLSVIVPFLYSYNIMCGHSYVVLQ